VHPGAGDQKSVEITGTRKTHQGCVLRGDRDYGHAQARMIHNYYGFPKALCDFNYPPGIA
jgi:hypothetical protein